MKSVRYFESPIGWLKIVTDAKYVKAINFVDHPDKDEGSFELADQARRQLEEYFSGRRKRFDLCLQPEGTPFQKSVWRALTAIEYGQTVSYQEIAHKIGNEKAVRAVGLANTRNPIPIIIPCHRVIGKNGKLVGYNSGVWRKEWLIRHEKKNNKKGDM